MPDDLKFKELSAANSRRGLEWSVPGDGPCFRGVELAGETGEACNIIKKLARGEAPGSLPDVEGIAKLADELGDIVICADRVAEWYGIDLAAAVREKFNKTSEKHGFLTKLPDAPSSECTFVPMSVKAQRDFLLLVISKIHGYDGSCADQFKGFALGMCENALAKVDAPPAEEKRGARCE